MEFGIGTPVPRHEDLRLLQGKGRYSDDVNLAGQAWLHVLRSPHGHALIRKIDIAKAKAAPGVLDVLTAEDYLADGLKSVPNGANPIDAIQSHRPALWNRDGSAPFVSPHIPLAHGRVRHVGEPVVAIVAETVEQAKDAAELIDVTYDALPAVVDLVEAVKPGAPAVWDELPGNIAADCEYGDPSGVIAAFERADHVVAMALRSTRVVNNQMEPRAAVGHYDPAAAKYTLYAGNQNAHRIRDCISVVFGTDKAHCRSVAWDVGGGYGPRNQLYPEFVFTLWASKRLGGRPVKWTGTRMEAFISDYQGRDHASKGELALRKDGRILALRLETLYAVGGISVSYVPMGNGIRLATSIYNIPLLHLKAKAVMTHTVPISPYRGAGRPESMYNIERLIDTAADEMGIDRVAIRRLNLIKPDQLPYVNPMGIPYDSGEFEVCLDKVLKLHDWTGFATRRADAESRGKLRGQGISMYVEIPVGALDEYASIEVQPQGKVAFLSGSLAQGQGHETTFRQVIHQYLGVPFDAIDMTWGDTDIIPWGGGTHSDRSMRLSGAVIVWSSEKIIEQGRKIAAHVLEAAEDDIAFAEGCFTVKGTDRSIGIFAVAAKANSTDVPEHLRGPLKGDHHLARRLPAYPSGSAICEVEIDPETGKVEIVRYSSVDDVGQVINPLVVHGQVHGGIVQGAGQVIGENAYYQPGTGQLIAGSFMDYQMPRADEYPSFRVAAHEVMAPSNPLGVKGAGEGGTVPALATVTNAVVDALRRYGVSHMPMPITAESVWRAINAGRAD